MMHFFLWKIYREKERHGRIRSSMHCLTLQVPDRPRGCRVSKLWAILYCFPKPQAERPGWEVEKPEQELALIWDLGTCKGEDLGTRPLGRASYSSLDTLQHCCHRPIGRRIQGVKGSALATSKNKGKSRGLWVRWLAVEFSSKSCRISDESFGNMAPSLSSKHKLYIIYL